MNTYEVITEDNTVIQFSTKKADVNAVAVLTDNEGKKHVVSKTSIKRYKPQFDYWWEKVVNDNFGWDVEIHFVRPVADVDQMQSDYLDAVAKLANTVSPAHKLDILTEISRLQSRIVRELEARLR
jgi:hypothetical protein